jgi:hypothetical protein
MSALYEIGIRGALETSCDWFPGMRIDNEEGEAVLRGMLVDQSALHGILATIRDLNLELLFVHRLDTPHERKEQS